MSLSPFWEALEEELPGQHKAVRALAAIVEHRALTHAYVFAGPPGAGKLRAAVALAAAENCDDHGCGDCALCKSVGALASQESVHPDISIVRPQGREYPIEQIRELRRGVHGRPVELETKFLVLLGADRMRPTSANALLKTLEEPPSRNCWVLVTDRFDELLPTVRSRCQLVQFRALGQEDVVSRLEREHGADRATALAAVGSAGGRLDLARALLAAPAFARARKAVDTLVEDLPHRDAHQLLSDAEDLAELIDDLGQAMRSDGRESAFGAEDIDELAVDAAHARRLKALGKEAERRAVLVARAEGAAVMLGLLSLAYRDLLCASAGAEDMVSDPAAVTRRGSVMRQAGVAGAARALEAITRARRRIMGNVLPKNALAAMMFEMGEEGRWHRRSA